jgi:hypothetical protein
MPTPRALTAAAATLGLALTATATATAQATTNRWLDRVDECYDFEIYQLCQHGKVLTTLTYTPAGPASYSFNYDIQLDLHGTPDYPCDGTDRWTNHEHVLFETTEPYGSPTRYLEANYVRRQTSTFVCDGAPIVTCTSYSMLQEGIDRVLHFFRFDATCTETPAT